LPDSPALVWFRHDLRLDDNPALWAAIDRGGPVIPVFIGAPEEEGAWPPGAASRWWLHQSLGRLDGDLRAVGTRLIIRQGASLDQLQQLIDETGAEAIFWNRRYEPAAITRDTTVKQVLRTRKLVAESFNGNLLFEPWEIATREGKPFQVFTAFWRAALSRPSPAEPRTAPSRLAAPERWPDSLPLEELGLEPRIDWAAGFRETWQPGAAGAEQRLQRFLDEAAQKYKFARDYPAEPGTSSLSPHLHFGEISPRRIWHDVQSWLAVARRAGTAEHGETFLKELGWREFAHHLLFHFPHTAEQPLRNRFDHFPHDDNQQLLAAWQKGRTGYPIVDAGMRELWHTGWMHNRVRMIVASFLVKDLLASWSSGAKWFWDTLVDADLANNTLGWQWTAGCGADAAPFFRIFNPVTQSQKFDPRGVYLRRWLPKLAALPDKWLHQPWEAPPDILQRAGIALGTTYPLPLVDHAAARQRALDAFKLM
jgi:deoxyribodipyrimidine photo-lyase